MHNNIRSQFALVHDLQEYEVIDGVTCNDPISTPEHLLLRLRESEKRARQHVRKQQATRW